MQTAIKAIETPYHGYRFRSRLEARWAVWLDACRIEWKYEDQGFDLGECGWYLPDFWLPGVRCFVEVKPRADLARRVVTNREYLRCSQLAEQSGHPVWMVCDPQLREMNRQSCSAVRAGYWDTAGEFRLRNIVELVICREAEPLPVPAGMSIEQEIAWLSQLIADKRKTISPDGWRDIDGGWLVNAFRAFRAARFEHGESGA